MKLPPSLLAATLGGISVFGFAPFALFPLPILALALLFRLWQRSESPRAAAWLGFCFGLGFFLAGVSWVYVSLHDVGGMAAPLAVIATVLFCGVLALFPALAGYAYRRLLQTEASADFYRNVLLAAGLWTLTEWLRGWLFTGFPWLALGYSQTPPSPLAGYAAVLGSYGIGFLAVLIAALLSFGLRRKSAWIAIAALLGAGALLRGMDWTQPTGQPVSVSLLQGNIPQSLKWVPERLPLSIDTYTRLARENPATLTILPETSIPLFFDQVPRETLQALTQHGDVLLGIAVRHREGGYVNGAVAITTTSADGAVSPAPTFQSYAKRHLVPFGEYIPPGFAWFFDLVHIPMSDFSAGPTRQAPLEIAGQRIAPNICYEDLFGEEIIAALPQATLLINLSNTAWFGDSLAQPQHLQIARMRALETGRTMLRATNTGITAAVAPDGRVLGALPAFTTGALRIEAQGFTGLTPYARWGNVLALLLAICACLPAFLAAYRQRQSR
ncbi:MAG: apolipoprotein N-acyltransferase [Rhodocyclaceae bacterium]|nr:apolipoprotein N-acyltransferase [Rhodocyclaceae bacterium]